MLKPGRYPATLIDSRLDSDKDGNPKPVLVFTVKDEEGHEHQIEWAGSMKSEKSEEMAYKTLLTAGWATSDLADLRSGLLAFATCSLSVEVEDNVYNGINKPRVKWVNENKGFQGQFKTNTSKVAALRAKMGKAPAPAKDNGGDLPF